MPKIVANGISVHYQQVGQGPDVVLIHGVTSDLSSWFLTTMPMLAENFRVTAYDLRGHGHSDLTPSGYTSAHLADDLDALLVALGIERAHLVGYSFGGTVAMHTALRHPSRVASLVLAEPWIGALRSVLDLEKWPYLEAAKMRLRQRGLMIPDEKWLDLEYVARHALQVRQEVGLRRGMERNRRRMQRLLDETTAMAEALEVSGLTLEQIGTIRQPALIVYGEFSPFLQLAPRVEASLPRGRVLVLDGVAHLFPVANPELLVDAARRFWDESELTVLTPKDRECESSRPQRS